MRWRETRLTDAPGEIEGIQAVSADVVSALTALHKSPLVVRSLQSYHERVRAEAERPAGAKV